MIQLPLPLGDAGCPGPFAIEDAIARCFDAPTLCSLRQALDTYAACNWISTREWARLSGLLLRHLAGQALV